MDFLSKFDISFSGLASGKHQFEFNLDDSFFEHFEHSVVEHAHIHAAISLNKQSTMLQLDFDINGTLTVECARCASHLDAPVNLKEHSLIKFGDHAEEEDIDIVMIPFSESKINVAQQLYEYVSTALPIRSVHPDDAKGNPTCDKKMLKVLKNITDHEKEVHKDHDHRWDALLKLKQEGLN